MLQRETRILLRQLGEPALLPSLRRADLDARATEVAEEVGERFRVVDVGRDDHLGRHRRAPP